MLVSFMQTYGNDRSKLHEIYSRDERMIEFKNMFDLNIHSFHNCSNKTIKNFKKLNKVKNTEYLVFNDMTYGDTIRELKNKLKEIGCTYLFFSQDDTFSSNYHTLDFKELLSYIKDNKSKLMINLYHNVDLIDSRFIPSIKLNTFGVYYITSEDFAKVGALSMDDTPFICSVDMLDIIYDDEYCSIDNVWDCEMYLNNKFKVTDINRYLLSKYVRTFMNYNIIGKTIGKKETNIQELKAMNLW